jgi:hypothetical protein
MLQSLFRFGPFQESESTETEFVPPDAATILNKQKARPMGLMDSQGSVLFRFQIPTEMVGLSGNVEKTPKS